MIDKHLNLFWHYGLGDLPKDHENNVTHAFVVTLRCLDTKTVNKIFHQLIPSLKGDGEWEFHLQNRADSRRKNEPGHLLGIATSKENWTGGSRPAKTDNRRLDALFRLPGKMVIGVESKLDDALDLSQVKDHLKWLGHEETEEKNENGETNLTRVRWSDVSKYMEYDHPVVKAFREYLEFLGLVMFSKFTDYDAKAWAECKKYRNNLRALGYLRTRLEGLQEALKEHGLWKEIGSKVDCLDPKKDSYKAGSELSVRWRLESIPEKSMTLNLFIDPLYPRDADTEYPVVYVSVFLGFTSTEKVIKAYGRFVEMLKDTTEAMNSEVVMDVWERPNKNTPWNNRKSVNAMQKSWPVSKVCTSSSVSEQIIKKSVDLSIPANERTFRPTISVCRRFKFDKGHDPDDFLQNVAKGMVDALKVMERLKFLTEHA